MRSFLVVSILISSVLASLHLRHEISATDPSLEGRGSWDCVLVHCREIYSKPNLHHNINHPDGDRSGTSVVINKIRELGFRRIFVYEKCGDRVDAPNWTMSPPVQYETIDMAAEGREEPGYVEHIIRSYEDLADWTLFIHGFPEQHTKHLFEWLTYFKRPVPVKPEYVSVVAGPFIQRAAYKFFLKEVGLEREVAETVSKMPQVEAERPYLLLDFQCCSQFMVSRQAIHKRGLDYWTRLRGLFTDPTFLEETRHAMKEAAKIPGSGVETDRAPGWIAKRPLWPAGGDAVQKLPATPSDGNEREVEPESSLPVYYAFEQTWHYIFGRPARDSMDEAYWCKWYENETLSPCSQRAEAFRQCWKEHGPHCPV